MDRCQTILPPQPPAFTTLRASLGALWFRISTAFRGAVRRASRPPPRPRILTASPLLTPVLVTPVLVAPVSDELASPVHSPQGTPEDDRWLRPTQVLTQRA
jgi:hypothetical protein